MRFFVISFILSFSTTCLGQPRTVQENIAMAKNSVDEDGFDENFGKRISAIGCLIPEPFVDLVFMIRDDEAMELGTDLWPVMKCNASCDSAQNCYDNGCTAQDIVDKRLEIIDAIYTKAPTFYEHFMKIYKRYDKKLQKMTNNAREFIYRLAKKFIKLSSDADVLDKNNWLKVANELAPHVVNYLNPTVYTNEERKSINTFVERYQPVIEDPEFRKILSEIYLVNSTESAKEAFEKMGGFLLNNSCALTAPTNGNEYDVAIKAEDKFREKHKAEEGLEETIDFLNSYNISELRELWSNLSTTEQSCFHRVQKRAYLFGFATPLMPKRDPQTWSQDFINRYTNYIIEFMQEFCPTVPILAMNQTMVEETIRENQYALKGSISYSYKYPGGEPRIFTFHNLLFSTDENFNHGYNQVPWLLVWLLKDVVGFPFWWIL